MLDVTDNLVGGAVVPPPEVVRHDGDDTYLVVAADKGTATFSDIANEIAVATGFWLGDAFASGGSAGYDHKKMAITARGAWESVQRHFREMGVNTQSTDFTVVGVGDMSGDVFGNGMLLSEHIRLVAAFDHRHVFIDPDPDPATSFAERRRLFDLPRSSWDDYDRSLLSEGGGIWPRTAKTIPMSRRMRELLGIESTAVKSLAPTELIRAILAAPVDLLWNGGIGTYVKSEDESHVDVGDKTNDPVRVNGAQVRATVIGEGGNLGLTQRGRIEYELSGGRPVDGVRQAHVCTDFIDNTAGVDCSDHEVNIKILLGGAVRDGELDRKQRDALLVEMTDEVADLVLQDNYGQARTLGNSRVQSRALLPVHRRMITEMERAGQLDRGLEAMPTDEELDARVAAGRGLTTPELAVMLAYTKIIADREVTDSSLPDDSWTNEVLADYFPTPLRERFGDRMRGHALRREIVSTVLVNETVNRGGISFLYRGTEETGASTADLVRAYVVMREVYDLPSLWRDIEALDNTVSTTAQTGLQLETRRLIDRAVRWLVTNRRSPIDVRGEIDRLRPGVQALMPALDRLFCGRELRSVHDHAATLTERGIPEELAGRATRVKYSFGLLDVVEVAHAAGRDLDEVAAVYYVLSDRFRVDELLSLISALPREDRWQTLARMALRYDLYAALAALTGEVLAASDASASAEEKVLQWEQTNAPSVSRARNAMAEFDDSRADLASLSVLLRQIRTLVRASAA
jgi:glutamate dehydrogenase